MKTLKNQRASVFHKNYEFKEKEYLSFGLIIFYDLTDPEILLKEQDLWQEIPHLLEKNPLLDQGWPKPRAEFLVAGSCCAPGNMLTQGERVSISVGSVTKELAIFGDRHWQTGTLGQKTISDPLPFNTMPLTWERAYGGEGFPCNPAGRGAAAVMGDEGEHVRLLPNIEDPDHLIGSVNDKPFPAGVGLVPAHLPQRARLSGTYDNRWKRDRWPGFADDLNPDFFLAAPRSQQMPGYFRGDEKIVIRNMHHEMPLITSSLPQRRFRLFFLRRPDHTKKNYLRKELIDGEFFEAELKADTLWLFPGILRGVLIYRALVPCVDEEYSDLAWAHIADEDPAEEPLPLEHYRDYVLEKADFGQTVLNEKMQELQRQLGKGAIAVRNLPKRFRMMEKEMKGRAPQMQASFEDMQAAFRKGLQQQRQLADEMGAGMKQMQKAFGHMVPVDFKGLECARQTIDNFESNLNKTGKQVNEAIRKKESMLKKAGQRLKASMSEEMLKQKGIDPDHLDKPQSVSSFHDRWFPFVVRSRMMLMADRGFIKSLDDLGLGQEVVSRNWLGLHEEDLAPEVPAGLVIPRFNGAVLTGVIIRPEPCTDPSQAAVIPESASEPLFLEAAQEEGPLVMVQDEMAAFLLEEETGDFADVTVIADPSGKPGKQAQERIDAGAPVVVILPEDTGEEVAHQWHKAFPDARFVFLHDADNVYDARRKGCDLREEILAQLPEPMARKNRMIIPEIAGTDAVGTSVKEVFNEEAIKDAITKGHQQVQAAMEVKISPMRKKGEEQLAAAKEKAETLGVALPEQPQPQEPSATNIAELLSALADKLDQQREKLAGMGILSNEKAEEMLKAAAKMREEGPMWQQRKEQLDKMEPPEEMKQAFAKHGIDAADLKPVTAEDLQERLATGRPFKMTMFSKLDLNGIDFSGKDLTMASFDSCSMKGCRFEGSVMEGTMVSKCDLEGADISGAKLERTMFTDCSMKRLHCSDTEVIMASFNKCDLEGADFSGSTLKLITIQKGSLQHATLAGARIELAIIKEALLSGVCFDRAYFFKTMMKGAVLDGITFKEIETEALLLHGCKGNNVAFEGSKLFKLRFGQESEFPGLRIASSKLEQGYFRNTVLTDAVVENCSLKQCMFDGCDLGNADFSRQTLLQCQFLKCDLERANLSKANLMMGSLRKTRIVNADLSNSNLYAVDFRKCVMGDTVIKGANLKNSLIEGREEELKEDNYIT